LGGDESQSNAGHSAHEEQLFLLLSQETMSPQRSSKTLKFEGTIQGVQVTILVDSGSSHSFLSSNISQSLSGFSQMKQPVCVQVANGGTLTCASELLQASWQVQGYQFVSDFKVLSLPYYDIILGMDWLVANSPI
jgi:hypothetical protein